MNKRGIYIYGIINSYTNMNLNSYNTKEGDKVYNIPHRDISAVVSDSKMFDFSLMTKDILARQLIKHQVVIEEIMNLGNTIIPMKLGTLVFNESEVKNLLDRGYSLSKDIFKKINDAVEIDLAVTWNDLTSVLKEIGEGKEIRDFKKKILENAREFTIENKIKIGAMIKNELDKLRENISSEILVYFKNACNGVKTHSLMDDRMVTNIALLIEKAKQKDFDRKVDELNSKFDGKLNFRCVGPLPPYSFYTLEIKKIQHKDIDWAKNKLKLENSRINKNEIRKAYQSLAFSCHPDVATGADKEFNEINKAYKILVESYQSCQQANDEEKYSFGTEAFKDYALFVKVKD